jgi:hypothetical protein
VRRALGTGRDEVEPCGEIEVHVVVAAPRARVLRLQRLAQVKRVEAAREARAEPFGVAGDPHGCCCRWAAPAARRGAALTGRTDLGGGYGYPAGRLARVGRRGQDVVLRVGQHPGKDNEQAQSSGHGK